MCSLSASPRILFEKYDLFVDDNEAPTPDPFDNVHDDNSLSFFHTPKDLPDTADGLVPSFKLEEDVPKPLQIPSTPVAARIIFENSDLFVDDNEAPLPDPFDNVYDDHSLSPFHAPQDIFEESEPNVVQISFDYVDEAGEKRSTRFIFKGLPEGMNVMDFSRIIDFLESVVHFIKQTGKGPPTDITIDVSPVTSQIIFEQNQLEVDDNEAPPPEPFDLVEQGDERVDPGYATNQAEEGVSRLGIVPNGDLPDVGKHKKTPEESVEVQKRSKMRKHGERKRHTTNVEEGGQETRNKRMRQETIATAASERAVDAQATEAFKVQSSSQFVFETLGARAINTKTLCWDYPNPEEDGNIDQVHSLSKLGQLLPCLGWQGAGPGFKWVLGEVLWDTHRASNMNDQVNDLESQYDQTRYKWTLQQAIDYARRVLATESIITCRAGEMYSRYQWTGATRDLNQAIEYCQEALAATPLGHNNRPAYLSNLACYLSSRYERTGAIGDRDQAIKCGRMALAATPLGHNTRYTYLTNLSNHLDSQYEQSGAIGDFDQAIEYRQEALEATPLGHNDRPRMLNNLARCLSSRYDRTGAIGDLEQAIGYSQEALAATPLGRNDRPGVLNSLANSLYLRYKRTGAIGDFDQAIEYCQEALAATPLGHNDRPSLLSNLANSLYFRYDRTGAIGDLEQAIGYSQEALAATPLGHNDRPGRLGNLAGYLSSRYKRTGAIGDLDQAIEYSQEALAATPLGHNDRHRGKGLSNLANKLSSRYDRAGAIEDLEQAIEYGQEALAATPLGHNDRPGMLNNLANYLSSRYERTVAIGDLEQAIGYSQEALAATPLGHNDRPGVLNSLASYLSYRYKRTGAIGDLEQAIGYSQEALAATPLGHNDRPGWLSSLANKLRSRYDRAGAIEDLDQAIGYNQEAVAATPLGHNDRPGWLSNLAWCLSSRYERTGAIGDLEQAIEYSQEALAATPLGHNHRPDRLDNLAGYLSSRYERTGAIGDLDQAIEYGQEALGATPLGHNSQPTKLNNLAIYLHSRYRRKGAIGDLDRAVEYSHDALAATPLGHNDRPGVLNSLARYLSSRYKRTGAIGDFDQPIEYCQEALAATPLGHNHRPGWLSNLAQCLNSQYERTGAIGDLDQAIEYSQEGLVAAPQGHPLRINCLFQRSSLFFQQFRITLSATDLDNSIHFLEEVLEEAWGSIASMPSMCVKVALALFLALYLYPKSTPCLPSTPQLGESYTPTSSSLVQKSFSFLEQSVLRLPEISPRILERQDQQFNLLRIGSLAESTASCALVAGKAASHALTLLELSRGIIMGFAIDCRGDLSELKIAHPKLCQTFTDLRGLIDIPPRQTSDDLTNSSSGIQSFDNAEARDRHRTYANQRREKAVREMETTIAKIRELPGHEGFQLPPPPEQLIVMAKHGPIVVFICSVIRSDAIIVSSSAIISITLPKLHCYDIPDKLEKITGLTKGNLRNYITRNKTMQEILCWLWNVAVEPVVRALELTVKSAGDPDLAHIWWIGVGKLSMAPFHAAGDYSNSDPRQNILSYAVSSYTPTIKALSYARERDLTITDGKPDSKLLLISMTETPGGGRLPDAAEEVKEIIQATNGSILTKHLPQPSAQTVLDELKQGSFKAIHFACHGKTDNKDPSGSHLILLKDGKADKLTVEDISGQSIGGVQLAYLSACSTAKNPDLRLADETIHIASGFQLAGFNHVIATMWPSESAVCREISQDFYRFLFDGNGHSDGHWKVRIALHGAVKKAQEKYPHSPLKWAPFIHMGA
ncbi:hypothetical protein Q9L58_009322 [Maublancomyces gigas]|uniref:CHAT domain-containing protein n=1 Tax=Discina gigas TaxID=1032678 RepID=A0ABR3G7Z3_9PEZI